ncbi:hypothetical protein SAMN02745121_06847 [Nannocystis exedens]|uniref:Uncharacterized protein n=1 Tax=Nannocystis exedens TaxID=54 RepID=A0A1I2FWE2_9BACT|nr:hypothetical protein [Nannocystis exedens]PCC73729.1 hypothetical protein NAEX_06817 [Nannocystis exedens]SFF08741.1 hypothetical protein SAMN02745121_06847 [Nannocystis exedens]
MVERTAGPLDPGRLELQKGVRPHPLAGFFTADAAAILSALDRLAAADEPARGRVVRAGPVPFLPGMPTAREGLWSEPYFGPSEARDPAAWGVVELPQPVLHPGLAPAIAAALGLREREVRAVAEMTAWIDAEGRTCTPPGHPGVDAPLDTWLHEWPPYPRDEELERLEAAADPGYRTRLAALYAARGIDAEAVARDDRSWQDEAYANTGPEALLARLSARLGPEAAARLMVWRVPVPPVDERPLERRPGGVLVAGARSGGLAALIDAAGRQARIVELGAPTIIEHHGLLVVQRALQAVLAAWGAIEAAEPTVAAGLPAAGGGPTEVPVWPVPTTHAELAAPRGLAFVAPGRAVLALATATFEVDLTTGALPRWWPSAGLSLMTCLAGYVLYAAGWRFCCFEPARGRWTRGALPACVPFVFAELQEVAFVIETASWRWHKLDALGDYPVDLRISPCARYLAARDKHGDGAVYRFDGELQLPLELPSQQAPVMWPEGQLREPTTRESDRLEDSAWGDAGLQALVLCEARDAWRRVQDGGVVEGARVLFRVPFALTAAAFDRAGREVLLAGEAELWHLALDPEPRLLARFDLRPLRALVLGPEGRSRPRPDALNAALCRHGTLLGVGDVEAAELARLNTASTFDEPKPLGLRRARTLAALARGVKRARKLPRLWPPT